MQDVAILILNEFFDWKGLDKLSNKEVVINDKKVTLYYESNYSSKVNGLLISSIIKTITTNWKEIEVTARNEYNHHLYEVIGEGDKPNKLEEDNFIDELEPVSCMIYFLHKNDEYDGFSLDLAGEKLQKRLGRRLEVEFNSQGELENDYFVVR